jgi:hypothetical protein
MKRISIKGFRPGKLTYRDTPLKNVIVVGQRVYQVKKRYTDGTILELYPRTWFRNNLIVVRFYLWRVKGAILQAWKKLSQTFLKAFVR